MKKIFTTLYKKDLLFKILLAIISGSLIFLSFPKTNLFFTAFLAIIPLIYIIEKEKSFKKVFLLGMVAQLVVVFGGFYWLIHTISIFGHLPFPVAILIFILYASFFGLKFPLFMLISKFIKNHFKISPYFLYPIVYTVIEFVFPDLFPWFLANSQHNNIYFIQIADITGVYGITFIVVLINVVILNIGKFFINKEKKQLHLKWILSTIGIIIFLYTYGILRVNHIENLRNKAKSIRIGAIQPCTPFVSAIRRQKHKQIRENVFRMSEELLNKYKVDLFIWPESAAQFLFRSGSYKKLYRTPIEEMVKKHKVLFMFSDIEATIWGYKKGILKEFMPYRSDATAIYKQMYIKQFRILKKRHYRYFNSAVLLDENANIIGNYRKVYPLPFGEYMPLGDTFPFLKKIFAEVSNFKAGNEIKVFKTKFGIIAPSVCYEIIIPSFTRRFIKKGANVIVNITNDAWFGKTKASYEHLSLAIFRSIENRVPIVRATNTGVTTLISSTGMLASRTTQIFKKDIFYGTIKPIKIRTFYTLYGNVFGWLIFLSFLAIFIFAKYYRFKKTKKIFFISINKFLK